MNTRNLNIQDSLSISNDRTLLFAKILHNFPLWFITWDGNFSREQRVICTQKFFQ